MIWPFQFEIGALIAVSCYKVYDISTNVTKTTSWFYCGVFYLALDLIS